MKKIFTLFAVAMLSAGIYATADVVTLDLSKPLNPTSLVYGDNGVWTECYNDEDYTWLEFGDRKGEIMLSHLIDGEGASWGGYYWDGFTPALGGDQTDYGQPGSSGSWTTNFGGCMAGGGCVIGADGSVSADASQPYLVAYYSSWAMEGPSNQVMCIDEDGNTTFTPIGVYVCNHPWPYYGCLHGDGFGRPFEEGDYFELIAHGVAADRTETTTKINLVEFTNGELHALNDWTFFDLSSLGEVESVYFTLNSTDAGDYGMNTAAYFCMDKFSVKNSHQTYYVVGGFNSWGEDTPLEITEDGATFEVVEDPNDSESKEFKIVTAGENDWVWFGGVDQNGVGYFDVTEGMMTDGTEITLDDDGANFRLPGSGSYTITLVKTDVSKAPVEGVKIVVKREDITPTSVTDINSKTVASVEYVNMAGQKSNTAFDGVNVMVTRYTDGSISSVKVVK